MWLRARKPSMERILGDVWSTLSTATTTVVKPVAANINYHLPGFGFKCLGVLGALLGYNIFVGYVTSHTEAWMFLEKLRLYAVGDELVKKGFFMSDAEDADTRAENYSHTTERLNSLWETALADATEARSFDKLCEHLTVDPSHLPDLPKPVSWRFSMMPYGRDDPDAKTFGFAPVDTPGGSNTPLLDLGSPGDYIDRQDNKSNPIRKGRHMYTAAYLPPTK